MNWIFNISSLGQKLDDQKYQKISFSQKRKFSAVTEENIVMLEYKNNNWVFTKYFKITSIEQNKIDDDYYEITIRLELKSTFKEDKLLEDYSYSLLRVTAFNKPFIHFNRKYSRLEDEEFEAIVNDKIYINRTILGTILNALHVDHQKTFIEYLAYEEPTLLTNKTDVEKALKYLFEYIQANIIEPINYLKSSGDIYRNIFGDEELNQLGFTEHIESEKIKKVKPQLEIIEKYQNYLLLFFEPKSINSKDLLWENRKFRQLFKNSRLPLNLK